MPAAQQLDLDDPQQAFAHIDGWLAQAPQPESARLGDSHRMLTALRTVAAAVKRLAQVEEALAAADDEVKNLRDYLAQLRADHPGLFADPDDEVTEED